MTTATTSATSTKAAPKKIRVRQFGVVDRASTNKTRRVVIEFQAKHPKYGKYVGRRSMLAVHDEHNESGVGDRIEIMPCRPMSKTKRWKLVRVVQKALGATPVLRDETAQDSGERTEAP